MTCSQVSKKDRPTGKFPSSETQTSTEKTEKKEEFKVLRPETSSDLNKKIPYREAVDAPHCIRPDLAYNVNVLTRKCHTYSIEDWIMVEKTIKNFTHKKDLKLTHLAKDTRLVSWSETSSGINDENGKSTSANLIQVFCDAIEWGTKRQGQVANSSVEAE